MPGRRKRSAAEYAKTYQNDDPPCTLELELAPGPGSGYAGVWRTSSGQWQAIVRVERRGEMVRRNVGSFDTPLEAAVARCRCCIPTTEENSSTYF